MAVLGYPAWGIGAGPGDDTPDGPALALLRVAARNPKAAIEALHRESTRGAAYLQPTAAGAIMSRHG